LKLKLPEIKFLAQAVLLYFAKEAQQLQLALCQRVPDEVIRVAHGLPTGARATA